MTGVIHLGDLQRAYRKMRLAQIRLELRIYLIERSAASAAAYRLVSRALYADSRIDNIGLTDVWVLTATEGERAALFARIATSQLRQS
jgi:hypothetical protein